VPDEPEYAIDDVAVPADTVELVHTMSTSIEVVAEAIVTAYETGQLETVQEPAIPELPRAPRPRSRYGRRYRGPEERARRTRSGTSRKLRERTELEARIARHEDAARFIPVVSRQGGVGATTVTAVLGMALADVRSDPVLAVDAHPERGTRGDRVEDRAAANVREIARRASRLLSAGELSDLAAHDVTGLDVLPSGEGTAPSRPLTAHAYDVVADVAGKFYSVVLTDGASGLLEPAMQAALHRADGLVLVSGGSADEARLATETIDWLNAHGLGELAGRTVVALNTATPGTDPKLLPQIETHFRARVRDVVRIPYDEELSPGPIRFGALRPYTRDSALDLAASVMDAAA
jgi:MinD-like ATPase involved in chromosome partitioning or flagellar assembly